MLRTRSRTILALIVVLLMFWGLSVVQAQSPRGASSLRAGVPSPSAIAVYSQPPAPAGGLLLSSLRDPEGSGADQWAWDGFRLAQSQGISEIRWRGAYDPARLGSGGPVLGFTVKIYASIAGETQPHLSRPPLAGFELANNAGETPAGPLGGVQTYDYRYILPAPWQAQGGVKYWLQIEALQAGSPDWGWSAGTDGDGYYFRRIPSQGPGYQVVAGMRRSPCWPVVPAACAWACR